LSAVLTWEIAGWGRANRPELDAVLARAGALAGHHGAGFESLNADRSDLTPRKPGEGGTAGRTGRTGASDRAPSPGSERTAGSGECGVRGSSPGPTMQPL